MSEERTQTGAYSPNNTPLRRDTTVDDAANPIETGYQIFDKVENLHVEPGSKPIPVGTTRRRD